MQFTSSFVAAPWYRESREAARRGGAPTRQPYGDGIGNKSQGEAGAPRETGMRAVRT